MAFYGSLFEKKNIWWIPEIESTSYYLYYFGYRSAGKGIVPRVPRPNTSLLGIDLRGCVSFLVFRGQIRLFYCHRIDLRPNQLCSRRRRLSIPVSFSMFLVRYVSTIYDSVGGIDLRGCVSFSMFLVRYVSKKRNKNVKNDTPPGMGQIIKVKSHVCAYP